jgi:hypothetical protein
MSQPRLSLKGLRGFPEEIDSSGKTLTLPFLEAADEVILIIESFGKLFTPIVMDMRGNSRQLLELYNKDPKSWIYLEDMALFAPEMNCRSWLLWLKRALELIERFFTYILVDEEILAQKSDNLSGHISKAYEEVLRVSSIEAINCLSLLMMSLFLSAISRFFYPKNLLFSLSICSF